MKSARKQNEQLSRTASEKLSIALGEMAHIPLLHYSDASEQRKKHPADRFHKLMYKRPSTRDIGLFCKKYKVSYHWLLAGDLKGLQRMMEAPHAAPAPATPESLKEKLTRLSKSDREVIRKIVDQLRSGVHERRRRSNRRRNRQRLASHGRRLRR